MKVIITNNSLDSLLSVQISTNNGQSYSTYSVSSLKDGLTFDCSPKDLKVICDVNTLKYIQVLADGEKANNSDVDLSNYIKIKDIYFHIYENPYYYYKDYDYLEDEEKEEIENLPYFEKALYDHKHAQYYFYFENYNGFGYLSRDAYIDSDDRGYNLSDFFDSDNYIGSDDDGNSYYEFDCTSLISDRGDEVSAFITVSNTSTYVNDNFDKDAGILYTNARIHFIKHF